MERNLFYITTPIYYVNAVPHIGNAYTSIACDVLARFNRQTGREVVFATGTDEHALKVAEVAQAMGKDTQLYVDSMEPLFKEQWQALDISYDDYIRTTEPRHVELVQKVFKKLLEQDDIYLGSYEGWYCVSDETFFTASEVTGETCPNPECRRKLSWVKEENYFFRLSKYQDRLLDYMTGNPGWLRPEYRANEVISFTRSGLKDQSVSRVNNGWGIPVPGDEKHVVYVWFDALLNYLTVAGYGVDDEKFSKVWPPSVQMMGKDIFVRFHCTLWPAMLMALGVEMPEKLVGHGFWTVENEKISKSRGNVVYPNALVKEISELSGADEKISSDVARYFLLREVPFGMDGDFSKQAIVNRFNTELANDLGNLLNRTVSMLHRYFGGEIPPCSEVSTELKEVAEQAAAQFRQSLDDFQFSKALEAAWTLVGAGNRYLEQKAPWALHREGREEELANALCNALECARVVVAMVWSFMPNASEAMWKQMGLSGSIEKLGWDSAVRFGSIAAGTKLGSADPTFPRIDTGKLKAVKAPKQEPKTAKGEAKKAEKELISYDDFKKLDIRAGRVVSAEPVDGADKLLKLKVDAGEDEPRQVVAGIAQYYKTEELVGKTVVLLANLQPAKIRGVESQGMLLAADVDGAAILLQPEKEVAPGSTVR